MVEPTPRSNPDTKLPDLPELIPPKKQRKFKFSKKMMLTGALCLVLLLSGGFLIWHRSEKSSNSIAQTVNPVTKLSTNVKTTPSLAEQAAIEIYDVAQFQSKDMAMFKSPITVFGTSCDSSGKNCDKPAYTAADLDYYKIGQTTASQGIFVMTNRDKGDGGRQYLFIEDTPGHYVIPVKSDASLSSSLQNNTSQYSWINDLAAALSPNYQLDTKTSLPVLSFPTFVNLNGLHLNIPFQSGMLLPHGLASLGIFTPYANTTLPIMKKIGSSDGKDFYQVTHRDVANYKVVEIYGTVKSTWQAAYKIDDPIVTNSEPLPVDWQSGDDTNAGYSAPVTGCGSPYGYVIPKGVTATNAPVIGTTKDGQPLYQLSPSSGLFDELYRDYYDAQSEFTPASLRDLTKEQFQSAHAVVLSKNALGEYMVHERSDMFIGGGCGKPVVYLYPTKKTDVSVKVDADVKISVPHYDSRTGWQHVTAYPSGALTYQGAAYDSLFWEGFGHGPYPPISKGTVVGQKDVVATIKRQLYAQGFNAKETADFLAYWQPKLPKTPYVRLSWLTTGQMNILAPLTITPQPTTVIRTFLDFEGLQTPVSLPAQSFTRPDRNGFTVVEWGGLLHDSSLQR